MARQAPTRPISLQIKNYELWIKYNNYSKVLDIRPRNGSGVSNPRPTGHMQSGMAMNVAQHKIINLLKTLWNFFCAYVSQCISRVAQDNSSSSSVAQRHQKDGPPWHNRWAMLATKAHSFAHHCLRGEGVGELKEPVRIRLCLWVWN